MTCFSTSTKRRASSLKIKKVSAEFFLATHGMAYVRRTQEADLARYVTAITDEYGVAEECRIRFFCSTNHLEWEGKF